MKTDPCWKHCHCTTLHIAVQNSNVQIAFFLVRRGASFLRRKVEGISPLRLYITSKSGQTIKLKIVRGPRGYLEDTREARLDSESMQDSQTLSCFLKNGRLAMLKVLLDAGAPSTHGRCEFEPRRWTTLEFVPNNNADIALLDLVIVRRI